MKLFVFFLFTCSLLYSNVYYSKVEPYEVRKISSDVNGVVLKVHEDMLGRKLTDKAYIVIDSQLDREELKTIKSKLKYLEETIQSSEKILDNLKASLKKKRANYKRVKDLKIKSSVEKDREFYDLISSENAYISTQKEINNLKIQAEDLSLRKVQLMRSIKDKNLIAKDFVLYEIDVKVGQVVNKATPLATVVDTRKAILTIYLNGADVSKVKNSLIYLDGKKTDYKISRILKIADSKNISKYKAQIIIKAPKIFSKLVEVELKESSDAK